MSVWPSLVTPGPPLSGREGELVSLRITVDSTLLEQLLEALADLPFPVNPQIFHHLDGGRIAAVEFPAYRRCLEGVRRLLRQRDFRSDCLQVRTMAEELQPMGAPAL